MSLTNEQFTQYVNAINQITAATVPELESMLGRVWKGFGKSDKGVLTKMTVEYAEAIAQKYGLASAAVSAALWEDIYHNDTGSRLEALIPTDKDLGGGFGEAAETVVGEKMESGDWDGALKFLTGITVKAVRDYARQTHIKSSKRVVSGHKPGYRNARYMRVPTGAETCAWCIMLAGRGPVYLSAQTAGADEAELNEMGMYHYHMWCDCEVVPSFDENPTLDGYDWHEYEAKYRDSVATDAKGRVDLTQTLHNMRQNHGLR